MTCSVVLKVLVAGCPQIQNVYPSTASMEQAFVHLRLSNTARIYGTNVATAAGYGGEGDGQEEYWNVSSLGSYPFQAHQHPAIHHVDLFRNELWLLNSGPRVGVAEKGSDIGKD